MSEKIRSVLAWVNLGLNITILIFLIIMFVTLTRNTRDIRNNFNKAEKQITKINEKLDTSEKALTSLKKDVSTVGDRTLILRDGSLTIAEFVDKVDADLSTLWNRVNEVGDNYATHLRVLHN